MGGATGGVGLVLGFVVVWVIGSLLGLFAVGGEVGAVGIFVFWIGV